MEINLNEAINDIIFIKQHEDNVLYTEPTDSMAQTLISILRQTYDPSIVEYIYIWISLTSGIEMNSKYIEKLD